MDNILMKCSYKNELHFTFYGTVAVVDDEIEFGDVRIEESGKPYSVDAETWAGTRLKDADALNDVFNRYCRDEHGDFTYELVCDELVALAAPYRKVALVHNDTSIYEKVRHGYMPYDYELICATDVFLYYANADMFLMLNVLTNEVIADNYFAEMGLYDSLKAVEIGTEKQLFLMEGFEL